MGQSLIEELQSIEGKLREQYKLAKENGEYLSTLQEYLHVSNLCVFFTKHNHLPKQEGYQFKQD